MLSSIYSSKPLLRNCKAKNSPNGSKFDNRAKCLIAVDALAWKGDLRIGEEVVKWKFYLRLAIIIPTLERVTIGCCEVDGGGGGGEVFGGGVFGGSVVISGDGVGNGVRGVVCGVTCGVVCDVVCGGLSWSHGAEGKDSFLKCVMTGNDDFVGVQLKAPISMMIVMVPEKDRWCGTRGKFVRWKCVRVTKASKRAKVGVRGDVQRHDTSVECFVYYKTQGHVTSGFELHCHWGDQDVDAKGNDY
ncbi:hypothetical protein Tco_0190145 [Tanacetum coccineum]